MPSALSTQRSLTVSVDVGGTFTDVTLVDRESGQAWKAKTPTTPPNFERGFIDGIKRALALAGRPPSDVAQVTHATTVATNAIIERKGERKGGARPADIWKGPAAAAADKVK